MKKPYGHVCSKKAEKNESQYDCILTGVILAKNKEGSQFCFNVRILVDSEGFNIIMSDPLSKKSDTYGLEKYIESYGGKIEITHICFITEMCGASVSIKSGNVTTWNFKKITDKNTKYIDSITINMSKWEKASEENVKLIFKCNFCGAIYQWFPEQLNDGTPLCNCGDDCKYVKTMIRRNYEKEKI